jgi:hypothetical protein
MHATCPHFIPLDLILRKINNNEAPLGFSPDPVEVPAKCGAFSRLLI